MFKKIISNKFGLYSFHKYFHFKPSININEFIKNYQNITEEIPQVENIAGRVYSIRKMGKNLTFMDLSSNGDNIQIVFHNKQFENTKLNEVKRGFILGLSGNPIKTKSGELSLKANTFYILSECNSNLPIMNRYDTDMLKDPETRYSKRYLDLIINNSHKNYFVTRSKIIKYIRSFLEKRGFLEVETPIVSHKAGGALASPFITYSKAMKTDLYLRIAPELYLKKLIIAGYEKVFEIGKNFRNEDISLRHNPEFTSCELYQSYSDYNDLIDLTKLFLKDLCLELTGDTKIIYNDKVIDFTSFKFFDVCTELENHFNIKFSNDKCTFFYQIDELYNNFYHSNKVSDITRNKKLEKLIENIIEIKTEQPSFIMNHPTLLSPLAKSNQHNPLFSERFEFYINKMELINAYSELTDPIEQKKRFEEQSVDEEIHPFDNDFIEALNIGMPPTAGWGIGIDRLVMIFLNQVNIKEVILFPQMNVK